MQLLTSLVLCGCLMIEHQVTSYPWWASAANATWETTDATSTEEGTTSWGCPLCGTYEFKCRDDCRCIPRSYLCDNYKDCHDGSDEPYTCVYSTSSEPRWTTTEATTPLRTTMEATTPLKYSIDNVRLVMGEGPWAGKLEVYSGGRWGRVCDAHWNNQAAQVICKMLRYSPERAKAHPSSRFGTSDIGLPFIARDFRCTGSEMSLTECSYMSFGFGQCWSYHDVGVDCFHSGDLTSEFSTAVNPTFSPEIILFEATTVTCDDKAFNVTVDTSILNQFGSGSGRYNHITLGKHGCSGHQVGGRLHIYAPITDCVDHVQETSSFVYYKGTLRLYHKEVGQITRDPVAEVEVECTLHRDLTIGGSYVVNKKSHIPSIIQAHADFNTTMEFFTDQYFHDRIDNWPHSVGLDQTVYVQVSVDSEDPDLSLRVQSCTAHDKRSQNFYTLIADRCPVDRTTAILPSGTDFARFKFSSFQFIGEEPEVYLNCNVTVCEPHDQSPLCYGRSCGGSSVSDPMTRHRVRAILTGGAQKANPNHIQVSGGPFLMTSEHIHVRKVLQLEEISPERTGNSDTELKIPATLVIIITVIASLLLVVIALFLKKRISGPVYVM